jgi:hypothetical protein
MSETKEVAIDQRFKTLRHIEAVRNHLGACIVELLKRAEQHDQSKLQSPEREAFDEFTSKLRGITYGSPEYKAMVSTVDGPMKKALQHHYGHNRHHPEHHKNGIKDMNLLDLLEMLCDWKSSSMRHNDGNILKSIEINQARFGFSEDLRIILENTAKWIDSQSVYHKAEES